MAVGNPNQDEVNKSAQDLRKSLQDILDSQGDYRNLIKSTIRELKSVDRSYEKIEARLASLNRGSVNVKQVNQELYKLKQKEYLEGRKLAELQREYGDGAKKILDKVKEQVRVESAFYEEANKHLDEKQKVQYDAHKEMLHYLEREGQLEAIKLYAQEKQLENSIERTEIGKKDLETEKMVSRQLGISGNLVGSLAKKLGVGSEAYSAMTESARGLVEKNGKATLSLVPMKAGLKSISSNLLSSFNASSGMTKVLGGAGLVIAGVSFAANKLAGALNKASGIVRGLSSSTSTVFATVASHLTVITDKIPIIGGLLGGLVGFWASILDLVVGVEDRIVRMGRQIGLSASEAMKLNDRFQDIAINSGKAYVNSKALFESQVQLSDVTGLNNIASKDNLETNIELAKFAGIELETRGKIYEASLATGTSMKSVASSIIGQVANLSQATGISFNYQKILKEAASQSGRLGLMFTKYPAQLAKTLVSVKALGFELKQLEAIGDGMLNFESSISKEFEVQLLLGKEINLNKAREAFLNGRLEEAATEITKQVGDANYFLNLNRIEQQSLADAMEMSVDSLSDLLKKQEIYTKLGAVDKKDLMEKIRLSRENTKERERIIQLITEEEYKNLVNLSTQEQLLETFEKIKASLADFLTRSNIADYIRNIMEELTKPGRVKAFINQVREGMLTVFDFISGLTNAMLTILQKIGSGLLLITFQFEKRESFNKLMADLESKADSFSSKIKESLSREITISEPKIEGKATSGVAGSTKPRVADFGQAEYRTINAKDAVVFPSNNMIINKDPLDYTIFVKNPAALSAPQGISQEAIEKIASAIMNRPVVVNTNTNLNLDGQIAARSNYTNMKNNPLIGFDKTFGQMSLNT